jgi:hypothetical protein
VLLFYLITISVVLEPLQASTVRILLGRVLRDIESHAGGRYGFPTAVVWPRLYVLLPESLRVRLDEQWDQIDLAARFSAAFAGSAAVTLLLLAGSQWWLLLVIPLLALAWLSYRAAIAAALARGVTMETAFDLYRFDLLRALYIPLPKSRFTEKALNEALTDFFTDNPNTDILYSFQGAANASTFSEGKPVALQSSSQSSHYRRGLLSRLRRLPREHE